MNQAEYDAWVAAGGSQQVVNALIEAAAPPGTGTSAEFYAGYGPKESSGAYPELGDTYYQAEPEAG
jgi:hypothetical protein